MNRRGLAALFLALCVCVALAQADERTMRLGLPEPFVPVVWRSPDSAPTPKQPDQGFAIVDAAVEPATLRVPAVHQEPPRLPVNLVQNKTVEPPLVPVPVGQDPLVSPGFGYQQKAGAPVGAAGPTVSMAPMAECAEAFSSGEGIPLTGRFWVRGDYLAWWTRGHNLPPLVTASPAGTRLADIGVFGPDRPTAVIFGGQQYEQSQPGLRIETGYWLDECQIWGVDAGYFTLGERTRTFAGESDGTIGLGRPFHSQNRQMPDSERLAVPGQSVGAVAIQLPTEFWGAEIHGRRNLNCGCNYTVDALVGYRYLNLREGLEIGEASDSLRGGQRLTRFDSFATANHFHGGQLGLAGEYRLGKWAFEGAFKLGLGLMEQELTVAGLTTVDRGLQRQATPGGLLAQPGNSGHFTRDRFGIAPELGLKVRYCINDHLRAFVGYDFLYLSDVLRPSEQLDRTLDIRQIPAFHDASTTPIPHVLGAPRPQLPFQTTDFWAQGLSVGLEIRY